jgi:hypothetical protein
MGCIEVKKVPYSQTNLVEESNLRIFEEEIGAFKKDLNHVLPRICIESEVISITKLENIILRDFPSDFITFIQQGYFYKEINGTKYYDARKINILLFLLCNDTLITNSKFSYHDKASFCFNFVRTREDQNLSDALEENEENFVKFVEDVVDVSCVGIPDCYTKMRVNAQEGMINKFVEFKDEIVKKLIKALFTTKDIRKSGGLTFEEINQKFDSNLLAFTSGHIREVAWEILTSGKAHEMEKKERQEEAERKKSKV